MGSAGYLQATLLVFALLMQVQSASAQTHLNDEVVSNDSVADSDKTPSVTPPAKLDRKTRVKALAALTGLAILGVVMITLVWMGGRMTRRYMRSSDKPKKRPIDAAFTDDWASKPLTEHERARLHSEKW